MEEMEGIRKEFEELAKRLENIEEVGTLELFNVNKELVNLDSKISLTYTAISTNPETDLYDKVEAGIIWKELKEQIRVKMIEAQNAYTSRRQLLNAQFAEYRSFKQYKRENLKRINEYRFELDKHRALLNHISDPFAKENMEDTIKDDEKHILRAEELNSRYDSQLVILERDCRILLEGGKLRTFEVVDEEEIMDEINKDSREMTNPVLTNNEEVEKPKEEERDFYHDTKELVAETYKVDNKETEKVHEEVKEEPKEEVKEEVELDLNKDVINPIASITVQREEPEEEKHEEEKPLKFVPADDDILPPKKEEETSGRRILPPRLEEDDEEKIVPPKKEEETSGRRILPPRLEEDDEEKIVPPRKEEKEESPKRRALPPRLEEDDYVGEAEIDDKEYEAEAKEPKERLWKKIGKAFGKAVIYLTILGAAFQAGIAAAKKSIKTDLNAKQEGIIEDTEMEVDETEKDVSESDVVNSPREGRSL